MTFLNALGLFNNGLVLLFGLFLSVSIAGGCRTLRQKPLVVLLGAALLALQGVCFALWGADTVRKLYPLIVHLPLLLVLTLALKKRPGVALISVCTAYLCCQIPRCVKLSALALSGEPVAGEIFYALAVALTFWLLQRCFVRTAHSAMTQSRQALLLFGSLPAAYYLFDYATAVYSDALYSRSTVLVEFLPTLLIVFYVIFLTAYHAQALKRTQAELQRSVLETQLRQSAAELNGLRRSEMQAAIYQHDMRHHLNAIEGFLAAGRIAQAEDYIKSVQADVEAITVQRFCENEAVNLLCSSFAERTRQADVRLRVHAKLPQALPVSDPELCSILSNALENALHAASSLDAPRRWIELHCSVKHGKLLVEINNPYGGTVVVRDGLPTANEAGHGYGTRSIRAICEQHRGLCSFEAADGLFTLRIALPLSRNAPTPAAV